ncbi:MAG: hypothetical protein JKX84_02140 [Flavobacteriales bacterium]|nr:hypothetical protein [Flavobacteriales bacterium]
MEWVSKLLKTDLNTFLRFAVVGAVWTSVNIGTDILFVDYFHLAGWLGTLIGYFILYVGRYYTYLLLKVIEARFWKYVYATIAFTMVIWIVKILALDVFHVKAIIASPIITGFSFIFKYLFYKQIKLIRHKSDG